MNTTAYQSISPSPARVVLYARYSSDLQRDASIEDQLRVCRARVEREGWQVQETFTDSATSGATILRAGYQALMTALRTGNVDIVLAESLDRFSRDLEHIASFYKHCIFNHVRIHTVSEGDISELHVGLKGTMGALYLKDLAEKTRRGLEGRIHAGRSIGSPAFGYTVVRKLKDDGELDRGLRAVDPDRAAVVRWIFEAHATGSSPRRIARELNAKGIAGPGGGGWYDASIIGRAKRGDGLLRNEIYAGRLVWRRHVNAKDPTNGTTVRRASRPEALVTAEVPDLRIIDEALWKRVQDRLKAETALMKGGPDGAVAAFWEQRRPRHLLSGKVICGACGRVFVQTGQDYLGCMAAVHGSCRNRRTIRRGKLQAQVLDMIGNQLMRPALVAEFVAAYNQERLRVAGEARATIESRQRERAALDRKINNLVDAISDGRSSPTIMAKLAEFEALRDKLGDPDSPAAMAAAALHPNIAEAYAASVDSLKAALARGDNPEAIETARALIDKVIVHPPEVDGDPPGVELIGKLMALLGAAGVPEAQASEKPGQPASVLATFVSSVKSAPGAKPRPPEAGHH